MHRKLHYISLSMRHTTFIISNHVVYLHSSYISVLHLSSIHYLHLILTATYHLALFFYRLFVLVDGLQTYLFIYLVHLEFIHEPELVTFKVVLIKYIKTIGVFSILFTSYLLLWVPGGVPLISNNAQSIPRAASGAS